MHFIRTSERGSGGFKADCSAPSDKMCIRDRYMGSIEINNTQEKLLSTFATYLNMDDVEVSLKPSTLFDHHFFVVGATNS